MILPAKMREQLDKTCIVTRGMDPCLYVYSLEEWQKIEEDFQTVLFGPIKRLVDPRRGAHEGRPVAKGEVRHGETHGVEPLFRNEFEIILGDIGVAVVFNELRKGFRLHFAAEPGLVLGVGRFKQVGLHPFL